jgi:DNA-binding XRE family transcriptional regulator
VTVETVAEAIARAVRARRLELGLTTEEAAERARIPEKAWRVVEQGISNPSSLVMGALCRALDWQPATIETLLQREVHVNGSGEIVVDLQAPIDDELPVVAPSPRVVTVLDSEGLTPAQLLDVQEYIDELRSENTPD